MKKRPKIKFTPCWKGPIEGFTVNIIRRFYPQVAGSYEFEDLLQEAYIKFLVCCRVYKNKIDNPAWFMSLYKQALTNQLITIVQRHRRYSFVEYQDPGTLPETPADSCEIIQVLKSLPKELLEVLTIMTDLTEISKDLTVAATRKIPTAKAKALQTYLST